jgi:saccharopine dehydrogenase-like NADP-dependent oxidoreductase
MRESVGSLHRHSGDPAGGSSWAAGPFQGQDYEVAQAAARAGAHYIDLADGRRFVCDFAAALDAEFRSTGRTALSAASTVPALSSALVERLTRGG